jgi:MoxR-like ATPase
MDQSIEFINEQVRKEAAFVKDLLAEIRKVIVGQDRLVRRLLISLLADGHILIEGVPGLAKTLTVQTISEAISAAFHRIQFTPDLLPADITGTQIYNPGSNEFTHRKGPIFANLVLADEINRAPAKVQSALLEAMQERQVSIGGRTYPLEAPFMVLATQNPIEQEGTYPLPEAQVDRFMLKVVITYPTREEERVILQRMTGQSMPKINPVIKPDQIIRAQQTVRDIYVDPKIQEYALDLVFATRQPDDHGLASLKPLIAFGASPRATIFMVATAKANAFLDGRGYVIPEDIKQIAPDILRHRVIVTYEAEAEEITSSNIIQQILDHIEVP